MVNSINTYSRLKNAQTHNIFITLIKYQLNIKPNLSLEYTFSLEEDVLGTVATLVMELPCAAS